MLRRLMDRLRRRDTDDRPVDAPASRDFAQDRQDRRDADMSDEDQAWQEASLRRNREQREQDPSSPGGSSSG